MTAEVIGRVPRVALIVVVLGLGTATLTLAANSTAPATPPAVVAPAAPQELVVPDVRRQAYVFAKGSLEQGGFAWRVDGAVPGYAANIVVAQTPAPGARVVADGNPIVVLRLERNGAYEQDGTPENAAPYPGKPARLVGSKPAAKQRVASKPVSKPARTIAAKPAPKTAKPAPAKAKPAVQAKPAAKAAQAQPCIHGRRRTSRAARRDCAPRPRAAARRLGRGAPSQDPEEREPLALPAQLDRHGRRLRLVGWRGRPANAARR